jgi:AAA domain
MAEFESLQPGTRGGVTFTRYEPNKPGQNGHKPNGPDDPFERGEAKAEFNDRAQADASDDKAPRFKLIKFKDARPDFSRRRELVQGLLPSAGIAVIWGPPKCYKSFWTYDLCMHLARGVNYQGRRVHQCAVVYVALEGQAGFPDRLEAYRQHHQMDEDVPFNLVCTQLSLTKDADVLIADIKAQIGDANPGTICLDTLNRSPEGSESNDEDMSAYLNAADKIALAFNCLVIIVHHCGIDGSRPRGHTSLSGAAVVQISVKRTADKFRASATVEMAKDIAEGAEVHFRLELVHIGTDADNNVVSSLVVLPSDAADAQQTVKAMGKGGQALMDALYECLDDRSRMIVRRAGMPPVKAVKVSDLRLEFDRRYVTGEADPRKSDQAKRMAFGRTLDKLPKDLFAAGVAENIEWIWKLK